MWEKFLSCLFFFLILGTGHARELQGRCFTPTLENGWVEAQESVTGDTFVGRFRCQPGFILSGATTVKCRQGRWSVRPDNFPLCAAIGTCDPANLPSIKNGWKKANPRYANSVYRYSCKKGYRMMGTSTVFCTQTGWSADHAPVCTRAGCDLTELMGEEGIQHGRARTLWGGAAIRFSCKAGSVLSGSSLAYCDGRTWNGTMPDCLVPPTQPTFSASLGGVEHDDLLVGVGEDVLLVCGSTGGNPAPSLHIHVGDEVVASTVSDSTVQYSLTVQPVHDKVQVYCTAENSMVHTPVHSPVQVIRLKYAASTTYIRGPEMVMSEEYTQYACSSDEADPAPTMEIIATDQDGEIIDINVEKMPIMKGRKGFAARVIFGINFEDHIKIANIECKAVNEVGEASSVLTTRVQYAPSNVDISGVTSVKHDEESVVYTCSSSASYPEATIVWNKLVRGNLEKIDEEDTEVETVNTKAGVVKSSKYTLHPAKTQEDSFLLFCIVQIKELKFEKSSEVLDILITYPPKKVFISGPDDVTVGDEAEYSCLVEGGVPTITPILVITDQYQNPVPMIPAGNHSITVVVTSHHETLLASCFAGNEAGFLQSTKEITVNYPPSDVVVSGPDHVQHGDDARYECAGGVGYPSPVIQWEVVSTSGDTVEFETEEDEDDNEKGPVSWLTLVANKTYKEITIKCRATNMAGHVENAVSTTVTYYPTHLILTGPTAVSTPTTATYYCSTDNSSPAAVITWQVQETDGTDLEVEEENIETYETALAEGGVQTHSVLTLPEYLVGNTTNLLVSCATHPTDQLWDVIEVTTEVSEELTMDNNEDDNEDIATTVHTELEDPETLESEDEEASGFVGSFSEEEMENANTPFRMVESKNEDKMVKLEAVEDDYINEYYTNYDEKSHISNIPDMEDAANDQIFQKSEVESGHVALKLGDSPRQHVEMSPYSSAHKPCLQVWLLVLTAAFFWRG